MPGTTSLTLPNEMLSLQTLRFLKRRAAMKDVPYRFIEDMLSKGRATIKGGDRVIVPFELEDHSTPTEVTGGGYGAWNQFVQPTHTPGSETFAYVVQPVMISGKERRQFRTLEEGVSEALGRVDNVRRHSRRQAQRAFLNGAAASGTWGGVPGFTSFLSVNGIDNSTHILEETASGTNTLHGLAKTSYPVTSHPQLHNVVIDAADAISSNLLPALSLGKHKMIANGNPMGTSHMWYTTQELAAGMETVYRTREWYGPGDKLDEANQFSAYIMGSPLIALPGIATFANLGATTATTQLSGIGIQWGEENGLAWHAFEGCSFEFDDWIDMPGTVGVQSCLHHIFGQLISGKRPGTNAVIINAQA